MKEKTPANRVSTEKMVSSEKTATPGKKVSPEKKVPSMKPSTDPSIKNKLPFRVWFISAMLVVVAGVHIVMGITGHGFEWKWIVLCLLAAVVYPIAEAKLKNDTETKDIQKTDPSAANIRAESRIEETSDELSEDQIESELAELANEEEEVDPELVK